MITKSELLTHTENKTGGNVRVDNVVVCPENKSTYRYVNNARQCVAKIRVDGGLIRNTGTKKCDWLVINWDLAHSFFIELKGSDIRKAISQINVTLDLLWSDVKKTGIDVAHARIVLSKTPRPNLMPNEKRKLEIRLKDKEYGGGTVKVQSEQMTETF